MYNRVPHKLHLKISNFQPTARLFKRLTIKLISIVIYWAPYCIFNNVHLTLHPRNCKQHTAHCTLHIAPCTLHTTAYYSLHSAHNCTLLLCHYAIYSSGGVARRISNWIGYPVYSSVKIVGMYISILLCLTYIMPTAREVTR